MTRWSCCSVLSLPDDTDPRGAWMGRTRRTMDLLAALDGATAVVLAGDGTGLREQRTNTAELDR
jgi:hypothetical protein